MILRKVFAGGLLSFFLALQLQAQIVDDSTKVIYGSNTTKAFTQKHLYLEKRSFFNKDTFYIRKTNVLPFQPNLQSYKRPELYTAHELDSLQKNDSIAKKAPVYFPSKGISDSLRRYDPAKAALLERKLKDSLARKHKLRPFKNNYDFDKIDTSIIDLHNYNYTYINHNIYQNLGIMGTPAKQVFYSQSENLGYSSGFNIYDNYFIEPEKWQFFDAKSSYSKVEYLNSTGGEDRIKGEITRNITRNWNVGISYQRLNTNKQISLTSSTLRPLASSQDFKFFTSFRSRNERYHFLGSFSYFVHKVNEQGGMTPTRISSSTGATETIQPNAVVDMSTWPVYLNAATSYNAPWLTAGSIFTRDRRVVYHFYHQYDILPEGKASIFHEFDRRNQKFRFQDPTVDGDTAFYPNRYNPGTVTGATWRLNDSTYFNQEFAYTTNKIGGKYKKDNWLAIGYYKNRRVMSGHGLSILHIGDIFRPLYLANTFLFNDPLSQINLSEHYMGGEFVYKFRGDSMYLHVKAEAMLGLSNSSTSDSLRNYITYKGDHNLSVYFKYYNMEAGFNRVLSAPSMLQLYSMDHNNFYWWNTFSGTQSNRLYFNYTLESRKHSLTLSPAFTQIIRYSYFDQNIAPQQLGWGQNIHLFTLDVDYKGASGILHYDLYAKYSFKFKNTPDVIRFPALYANAKVYLHLTPRKKAGKHQLITGLDFHFRSTYYGDAYMPAIGQYHLQDDFPLLNYLLVDWYATAKIRNANIFARFNQINQLAGLTQGYYISPYYPGTGPFFVLGVRWMFFE